MASANAMIARTAAFPHDPRSASAIANANNAGQNNITQARLNAGGLRNGRTGCGVNHFKGIIAIESGCIPSLCRGIIAGK
jgi:hypothetical protein